MTKDSRWIKARQKNQWEKEAEKDAYPAAKDREREKIEDEKKDLESKARPSRASIILKMAKNLESNGKMKPALENYRRVISEYGDTPSAKEAAERIKALTGK